MSWIAYLPHVIYSTALISISMHHLSARHSAESDRSHVAAQLSLLTDLRDRLRDPGNDSVSDAEADKILRLAQSHDVFKRAQPTAGMGAGLGAEADELTSQMQAGERVGWREVIFGRRTDMARTEELDRRDLERVRTEIERSESSGR
ncbi:uncharacterized protein BXZ73DRAFT_107215 [Epithele typhae]|uniref:uncharacterized protein n=1 Tax=Epithele typhae TaxID=378194 RepID=UPI002008A0F9|nr:uncharacterized protein BXZ73DRAFT_107215 [Epithele typhae]KAH9912767.1 hypothetical protein BXZ73DRAFT_107215 [Epithele typhae]